MATVSFSVPDAVKEAFNATFADQNKSAIIAELMREAVERARRRQQCIAAAERILDRRAKAPMVSEQERRAARDAERL